MEKQKNMPQLRFPEFEGEWENLKLGELSKSIHSGKDSNVFDGNYPLYGSMGIIGKSSSPTYEGKYILVARVGANAGSINLVEDSFGVTDNTLVIENDSRIDTDFEYYLLKVANLNRYIFGSGQPLVTGSMLKALKVLIPSLPEQLKIASFFTAIDQKISQLKRKLTLLEQYKKGVIQKIFSQEIRFKDDNGQEFPKWKEKKLEDLGSIRMCKRIFAHQTQKTGEVPFFKIGTIGNIADAYISIDLFNEYKSRYNYPIKGQTLITCSGTIGKCVQFDGRDSYYQDSNIVWIDNTDKEVLDDFLYILLSNYKWGKLNSTTITRIYTNDLKALKFKFPTKTEQIKIANFLSAIDNKIDHTQKQIEKAEVWKKGLMQQMFV